MLITPDRLKKNPELKCTWHELELIEENLNTSARDVIMQSNSFFDNPEDSELKIIEHETNFHVLIMVCE